MKKRIDSAYIDNAIEEIGNPENGLSTEKQLEQYKSLLGKAQSISYKKGIAALGKTIAVILTRWRRYAEAAPYLQESLKIISAAKQRDELYFELMLTKAQLGTVKGRLKEAIAIVDELITAYRNNMTPVMLIRCYLTMGNAYWMQGLSYNALYTYQKVLQQKDELSNVTGYNIAWISYANVLKDLKLFDRARDEMNAILKEANLSPRDRMVININLANLYAGYKDIANCEKYMAASYKLLELHPYPEIKYSANANRPANLVMLGKYEEALRYLLDKEMMRPQDFNKRDEAEWKYMIARCLIETGKLKDAEPWLQQTEKLINDTGLILQKAQHYDNYFLYHSLQGNDKEARNYHHMYREALDESNKMTHNLQAQQLDALVNLERKERELEVEKLQHRQAEREAEHTRQQNALMQANIEQRNKLIDEFQAAIKRLELSDARRKEIFKGLHDKINTVKRNSAELEAYDTKFNTAHHEQTQILHKFYPSITTSEAKIAVMLASGLSNKEISAITLTTTRNIETQRFNLRKKMKLKAGQDLVEKINGLIAKSDSK